MHCRSQPKSTRLLRGSLVEGLLRARGRVRRGQLLGVGRYVFAREGRCRLGRHGRRPQGERPAPSGGFLLILRLRAASRLSNCAKKRIFLCCLGDSVSVCIRNDSVLVSDILFEEVDMIGND